MGGLFNLPPRATKAGDSLLAKKASRTPQTANISIKGGGGILERISIITATVNKNLGRYADRYEIIRDEAELVRYIDSCIENRIVSIDTETDSLDPITTSLAGLSLYTRGNKAAYVPLHHVSYITNVELENQLSDAFVAEQMQRLVDNNVKVVMFNAKFDIRVIKNQLGIELYPYWDGYIAARLLNENEPENNLKALHKKYCMNGEGDAFTFDSLFKGIPFPLIPLHTGYLYGARDAEITYELYEFQRPFLTADDPVCIERDLTGVAYVFNQIEMPIVPIIAEMEDTGVAFDFEFAEELSDKYNKQLDEAREEFYAECENYAEEIEDYRMNIGLASKLDNPINISSPTQIAILLYDILNIQPVDNSKPRGTGEEILVKIDNPLTRSILKYRGIEKLLTTYIEKMPTIANEQTGRVHASFNQMGADTGRFSSADPNMQNIPARNNEIRRMFKATDGYLMLSSDYSAQEPRLAAHMSGDEKMIEAYKQNKDLYVEIASIAYDMPYEECTEFRPDGTKNPEGKKRRSAAKAIVLGVLYGKGVPAIAEDLGVNRDTAQTIYDKVMHSFPDLEKFMQDSLNMARELGYVTTVWGRKRRLPNMQLDPYEFSYIGAPKTFDPLFDDADDYYYEVDEATVRKYTRLMDRAYGRAKKNLIKEQAKKEGIHIKDNGGFIAEATRQTVNCVDDKTEILTGQGWKTIYELRETDDVLTFNPDTQKLEWNELLAINKYEGNFDMLEFSHKSFSACTTPNHRWAVDMKGKIRWRTSDKLASYGDGYSDWRIPKCADNDFAEGEYEDWFLQLVGYFLTDGSIGETSNNIKVYQSSTVNPDKCEIIENTFKESGKQYSKYVTKDGYIAWNLGFDTGRKIRDMFPDRELTYDFMFSLSQRQANVLIEAMLLGDGEVSPKETKICCRNKKVADAFQALCQVAGISTSLTEVDAIGRKAYSTKISNKCGYIETKKLYYIVRLLRRKYTHVYPKHQTQTTTNLVWCPTTKNETWIARRNGRTYITGNSRIQGSAADQTKIAMQLIGKNKELRDLGFRMLLVVHDEIIGECPKENVKEVAELFSSLMVEAAKDLKVPSRCDVEITDRWYGKRIEI